MSVGEALSTASGRNTERAEVNRNERSARWVVATIEVAELKLRRYLATGEPQAMTELSTAA